MKITIETDGVAGMSGVTASFQVDETEGRFEELLSALCDWMIEAGVPATELHEGLTGGAEGLAQDDVFLEGFQNGGLIKPPDFGVN
jgi:hypothetical protein